MRIARPNITWTPDSRTIVNEIETFFATMQERLAANPWAATLLGLSLLGLGAVAATLVTRSVLRIALQRVFRIAKAEPVIARRVLRRLSWIVPAVIVYWGIAAVPGVGPAVETGVRNLAAAAIVFFVVRTLSAMLDGVNTVYMRRPEARRRPIKGYVEVVKILLYIAAAVLAIAVMMNESPLLILSGFGAMAAVLMLVFKDTILGLVASVQLSNNDMLRVGDWIEMPSAGADGDVIDIALHTVKVLNWDKTVTTIPTWKMINESYRNWRSMFESGGRRIKRSLLIDVASVRFLTDEDRKRLKKFALLEKYLDSKEQEIASWNANLGEAASVAVNTRRLTNLGTFRAYVSEFLKAHPRIAQSMTQIVRQLQPTSEGLPLEIYCFTSTVAWVEYEGIQADIFDHIIALLPEFGLRLYQAPAGADFAGAIAESGRGPRPRVEA